MGLGCKAGTARLLLIIINTIFFILGAAALALGVIVLVDENQIYALAEISPSGGLPDNMNIPGLLEEGAYVITAAGGFIFLLAFLGCCGACYKVQIFLKVYYFLIGVLILAEIVAIIMAIVFWESVQMHMRTFLNNTIAEKYEGMKLLEEGIAVESTEPFSIAWDFAHVWMKCCGMTDYKDYQGAKSWNRTLEEPYKGISVKQIPISCCKLKHVKDFPYTLTENSFKNLSGCISDPNNNNAFTDGCYSKLLDLFDEHSMMLIVISVVIVLVQLVAIVFACCLDEAIKNNKYDVY